MARIVVYLMYLGFPWAMADPPMAKAKTWYWLTRDLQALALVIGTWGLRSEIRYRQAIDHASLAA